MTLDRKIPPLALLICALFPLLGTSGCFLWQHKRSSAQCRSVPTWYEKQIAKPVIASHCINCHTSNGLAQETRYILTPGNDLANLATLKVLAPLTVNGMPLLIAKPTEQVSHGGGHQLDPGAPETQAFAQLVSALAECSAEDALGEDGAKLADQIADKIDKQTDDATPAWLAADIRRLSSPEYVKTITAIAGSSGKLATALPADERQAGFTRNTAMVANAAWFGAVDTNLETLVAGLSDNTITSIAACANGSSEDNCAKAMIKRVAHQAFRRPLTAADEADLFTLYQKGRDTGTFIDGARWLLQGILEAASTIYVTELGSGTDALVDLTPHELASVLAYTLTGGPPDAALLAAADGGSVDVAAHANRLWGTDDAKAQVRRFVKEWLEIDQVAVVAKDNATYPDYTPSLRQKLETEVDMLVDDLVFQNNGGAAALLTSNYSYMDSTLTTYYGLGGGGSSFAKVTLDGSHLGVLTQGAFLAVHARPNESSPTKRGSAIRRRVMCYEMPKPPAGVPALPAMRDPNATTRERFATHVSDPICATCHNLMDKLGNGFENFDGMGSVRTTDNNKPVDTSGEIVQAPGIEGSFTNGPDLARKLAGWNEVTSCFALQYFRFASAQNSAGTEAMFKQQAAPKVDILHDIAMNLVASDMFKKRSKQ